MEPQGMFVQQGRTALRVVRTLIAVPQVLFLITQRIRNLLTVEIVQVDSSAMDGETLVLRMSAMLGFTAPQDRVRETQMV